MLSCSGTCLPMGSGLVTVVLKKPSHSSRPYSPAQWLWRLPVWGRHQGMRVLNCLSAGSHGVPEPQEMGRRVRNAELCCFQTHLEGGRSRGPAYLLHRCRRPAAPRCCCGRSSCPGACSAASWSWCRPSAAPPGWAGPSSRSPEPRGCDASGPPPERSCPGDTHKSISYH